MEERRREREIINKICKENGQASERGRKSVRGRRRSREKEKVQGGGREREKAEKNVFNSHPLMVAGPV